MIVFAPQGDRLLLLAQNVTKELAEIIMIQGVGGAFHTVFTAATMAMNRLCAAFSISNRSPCALTLTSRSKR